jgi:outer membrane lipoprotein-sorting protein
MKKLYMFIAICAAAVFASSCSNNNGPEPSAIVTDFYKDVTTMKFDNAAKHCVEGALDEYINGYKGEFEALQAKDKKLAAKVQEKAALTTITIGETIKEKDVRTVTFTLTDDSGNTKEKIAVLKKVEKEWKIAEIKDKQ